MYNFKKNKLVYVMLTLALAVILTKAVSDMMGYRMLDVVSNNKDKQASETPYGASHK